MPPDKESTGHSGVPTNRSNSSEKKEDSTLNGAFLGHLTADPVDDRTFGEACLVDAVIQKEDEEKSGWQSGERGGEVKNIRQSGCLESAWTDAPQNKNQKISGMRSDRAEKDADRFSAWQTPRMEGMDEAVSFEDGFTYKMDHGCEIHFTRERGWKAIVSERIGWFSRTRCLPVFCQGNGNVEKEIAKLKEKHPNGLRPWIHLLAKEGLVYLGLQGLRGGKKSEGSQSTIGAETLENLPSEVSIETNHEVPPFHMHEDFSYVRNRIPAADVNMISDVVELPVCFESMSEQPLEKQLEDLWANKHAPEPVPLSSRMENTEDPASGTHTTNNENLDLQEAKQNEESEHPTSNQPQSLRDYVAQSEINSIPELVAAINACGDITERSLLFEWAAEYVDAFSETLTKKWTTAELNEYFSFMRINPATQASKQFLMKWISSIVKRVVQCDRVDDVLVEQIEFMLHCVDIDVFTQDPAALVSLCESLMSKLDVSGNVELRSTYLEHCRTLYTIRQALVLLQDVSPNEWDLHREGSLYKRFTNQLKTIGQSCQHYPTRVVSELLAESLHQFKLVGFHHRKWDTEQRSDPSEKEAVFSVDMLRYLDTLGVDLDTFRSGCKTWQDALRVNTNANLKQWYRQFQNLNKDCLLAIDNLADFLKFLDEVKTIRRRMPHSSKDDGHRVLKFEIIHLLHRLATSATSEDIQLRSLQELIKVRAKWYADKDIVMEVLETLTALATQGGNFIKTQAREALLKWQGMSIPSCMPRLLRALNPKKGRSKLSKKQKVSLRSSMNEWLGALTVEEKLSECAACLTDFDPSSNVFFQSVMNMARAFKSLQGNTRSSHERCLQGSLSVPPLVDHFTGQEEELAVIQQSFLDGEDLVVAPPIVGTESIGKSQFAIKAVHIQRQTTNYTHEFWIPSSSRQTLIDAHMRMALLLGIRLDEDVEITIECVRSRLKRCLCLYVFDDAPCLSTIKPFLPLEKGHVIITSNQAEPTSWQSNPLFVTPKAFNESDALGLAAKFGFKDDDLVRKGMFEGFKNIVRHPLALTLLLSSLREKEKGRSAPIGSKQSSTDWAEAIEQLTKCQGCASDDQIALDQNNTQDHSHAIISVVRMVLDALDESPETERDLAQRLLAYVSCLDSAAVPLGWILLWDSEDQTLRRTSVRKALSLLERLSLVQLDIDHEQVHMHAATQSAVRQLLPVTDCFASLVQSLRDFGGKPLVESCSSGRCLSTLPHGRALFDRMKALRCASSILQQLAQHLSWTCSIVCHAEESQFWAQMRLEVARNSEDDGANEELVKALADMAQTLEAAGDHTKAWELWKEATDVVVRLRRDYDKLQIAKILCSFGHRTHRLGKAEEALEAYELAFGLFANLPEDEEPNFFAQLLNNMADCQSELGFHDESLDTREEVLRRAYLLYGDKDHSNLSHCITNVGSAMAKSERGEEAICVFELALKMETRLHEGKEHVDVCQALHNLGCISTTLGRRREAIFYSKRALDMSRRLHGRRDHLAAAKTLHIRGKSLSQYGFYGEGLQCSVEALRMAQRLFRDKDHPDLARFHGTVGQIHLEQNEAGEASLHLERAYSMSLKAHKSALHPSVLTYRDLLDRASSKIGSSVWRSTTPSGVIGNSSSGVTSPSLK